MFSLIAGFFGKMIGSTVQAAVNTGSELVGKAGDLVSSATKDPGDLASARQFAAPNSGGGWIRTTADGLNCLIRPTVAFFLIGVVFGWWRAPDLTNVAAVYIDWFERIMAFIFGQRAVVYDLPRLLSAMKSAIRK